MKKVNFRTQFGESPLGDAEKYYAESPVVAGQALTGAELFRRMSSGLPVGCAIRNFNQVNPYLEKFSIYDSIGAFKLRHGMLDETMIEKEDVSTSPEGVEPGKTDPQPQQ